MKCKFCNSGKVKNIRNIFSDYINQNFILYECEDCKCRFFDIAEHKIDLGAYYQEVSEDIYEVISKPSKAKRTWLKQKQRIIKYLGKNPDSILDVGCRTGNFLMNFNKEIQREGVELSSTYTSICRERGLTVYNDFLENINFNGKYDVVSCYAILEHLQYPIVFINKLQTLVNPDGLLVIMIPYYKSFKEKILSTFNIKWHMYNPPEHLNFYSKVFLENYLKQNRFKLIKSYYSSGGMFNPFHLKFIKKTFGFLMYHIDENSPINQLPIFDYLYLYFRKIEEI
jgi:SAM-dependent methyltransferase